MWTPVKRLLKSPIGRVGLVLATSPLWKPIYNVIDALGNIQFVADSLPAVLRFLGSAPGTISIMLAGFSLLGLQIYKQQHKELPKESEPKLLEAQPVQESEVKPAECPYQWLHDMADAQAKRITEYAVLIEIVSNKYLNEPIPYILFVFHVLNKSVFQIAFNNAVEGFIEFRSTQLAEKLLVRYNPENVSPGNDCGFVLEQRLSKAEAQYILDSESIPDALFYFDRLFITIKGSNGFPQVKPEYLVIKKSLPASKNSIQVPR